MTQLCSPNLPTRAGSHPFPSPAVIQGLLLCCGFFTASGAEKKYVGMTAMSALPEGSILRNSPAGCGTSLGFNSGRVWKTHSGTVPGLPLPRTSGDQLWGSALGSSNPTTISDCSSPGGQLVPEHKPCHSAKGCKSLARKASDLSRYKRGWQVQMSQHSIILRHSKAPDLLLLSANSTEGLSLPNR